LVKVFSYRNFDKTIRLGQFIYKIQKDNQQQYEGGDGHVILIFILYKKKRKTFKNNNFCNKSTEC